MSSYIVSLLFAIWLFRKNKMCGVNVVGDCVCVVEKYKVKCLCSGESD